MENTSLLLDVDDLLCRGETYSRMCRSCPVSYLLDGEDVSAIIVLYNSLDDIKRLFGLKLVGIKRNEMADYVKCLEERVKIGERACQCLMSKYLDWGNLRDMYELRQDEDMNRLDSVSKILNELNTQFLRKNFRKINSRTLKNAEAAKKAFLARQSRGERYGEIIEGFTGTLRSTISAQRPGFEYSTTPLFETELVEGF